jgi:hypothetical protein
MVRVCVCAGAGARCGGWAAAAAEPAPRRRWPERTAAAAAAAAACGRRRRGGGHAAAQEARRQAARRAAARAARCRCRARARPTATAAAACAAHAATERAAAVAGGGAGRRDALRARPDGAHQARQAHAATARSHRGGGTHTFSLSCIRASVSARFRVLIAAALRLLRAGAARAGEHEWRVRARRLVPHAQQRLTVRTRPLAHSLALVRVLHTSPPC